MSGPAVLAVAACAGAAAAWPVGTAVGAVGVLAGPHNWAEARYFIGRLAPRWGRRRAYYATGLVGAAGLTATFWAIAWAGRADLLAAWDAALVVWAAVLLVMRGREGGGRRLDWAVAPAGDRKSVV